MKASGPLTPPAATYATAINAVIIAAVEGIAIPGPAGMAAEARLLPDLQPMLRAACA